jgi:hypothetical protein
VTARRSISEDWVKAVEGAECIGTFFQEILFRADMSERECCPREKIV